MAKNYNQMRKELEEAVIDVTTTKQEMKLQREHYEEEVQLRLQFESKLNSLHALHRDVKAMYRRAIEDIHDLEKFNKEKALNLDTQKKELVELKMVKVEHETKIKTQ